MPLFDKPASGNTASRNNWIAVASARSVSMTLLHMAELI